MAKHKSGHDIGHMIQRYVRHSIELFLCRPNFHFGFLYSLSNTALFCPMTALYHETIFSVVSFILGMLLTEISFKLNNCGYFDPRGRGGGLFVKSVHYFTRHTGFVLGRFIILQCMRRGKVILKR